MAGEPGSPFPELQHLDATTPPELRRPVLLAAFEGWNDAGNAATTAVKFLGDQWGVAGFASIDPEEFYDFSSTRPIVRFDEAREREIVWPENLFAGVRGVATDLDVVTLRGVEPQLRWRTFCEQIVGVALALDVRLVVTIGALLAEVPHTRPVSVFGTAYDDDVIDELSLRPSQYEGPTGIVGVLHAACREAGLHSASLWAAVPTYIPSAPSPKAALALVQKATGMLGVSVPMGELEIASRSYEEQVNEVVANDDETSDYVSQLEQTFDDNQDVFDSGPSLVEEVERFLRDQD